jgi:hypothetical protein
MQTAIIKKMKNPITPLLKLKINLTIITLSGYHTW